MKTAHPFRCISEGHGSGERYARLDRRALPQRNSDPGGKRCLVLTEERRPRCGRSSPIRVRRLFTAGSEGYEIRTQYQQNTPLPHPEDGGDADATTRSSMSGGRLQRPFGACKQVACGIRQKPPPFLVSRISPPGSNSQRLSAEACPSSARRRNGWAVLFEVVVKGIVRRSGIFGVIGSVLLGRTKIPGTFVFIDRHARC